MFSCLHVFFAITLAAAPLLAITADAAVPAPLTLGDLDLPTTQLATKFLGEQLGSRVIQVVRHADESAPEYVDFYTQPELTNPRLNGICRTDVITVEYEAVSDTPASTTPLRIAHVQARGKYKSFPVPAGQLGSAENDRAQAQACATMKTALDAFEAPSAGDAQWLAKIERQYSNERGSFRFTCEDFDDRSCAKASRQLSHLTLNSAKRVQSVDCPKVRTGDAMDSCYRLSFLYAGEPCSGRQDFSDIDCDGIEWVLTVFAGIKEGDSPVRIRSVHLEHYPKPIAIP